MPGVINRLLDVVFGGDDQHRVSFFASTSHSVEVRNITHTIVVAYPSACAHIQEFRSVEWGGRCLARTSTLVRLPLNDCFVVEVDDAAASPARSGTVL